MRPARLLIVLAAIVGLSAGGSAPHAAPTVRGSARPGSVLPFIADDYSRALAEARALKVPLFIESWAPW